MNEIDKRKKECLFLRKRFIFEKTKFQCISGFVFWYVFFLAILELAVFSKYGTSTANEQIMNFFIFFGKLVVVLLFVGAFIDNVKHNRLIKNGKVVIAEIDKCRYSFNMFLFFYTKRKIACSYLDYESNQIWNFTGRYAEFGNRRKMSALTQEWQIPVLVDEKNYSKYYILTKELVHSYRESLFDKPFYLTRVVREVDLRDVENGMKFSASVKFR